MLLFIFLFYFISISLSCSRSFSTLSSVPFLEHFSYCLLNEDIKCNTIAACKHILCRYRKQLFFNLFNIEPVYKMNIESCLWCYWHMHTHCTLHIAFHGCTERECTCTCTSTVQPVHKIAQCFRCCKRLGRRQKTEVCTNSKFRYSSGKRVDFLEIL